MLAEAECRTRILCLLAYAIIHQLIIRKYEGVNAEDRIDPLLSIPPISYFTSLKTPRFCCKGISFVNRKRFWVTELGVKLVRHKLASKW